MARVSIYVTLKPGLLDAQGRTLEHALHSLDYKDVSKVRVGKYLELEVADNGSIDRSVREMCDKLLANPVIENYRFKVER